MLRTQILVFQLKRLELSQFYQHHHWLLLQDPILTNGQRYSYHHRSLSCELLRCLHLTWQSSKIYKLKFWNMSKDMASFTPVAITLMSFTLINISNIQKYISIYTSYKCLRTFYTKLRLQCSRGRLQKNTALRGIICYITIQEPFVWHNKIFGWGVQLLISRNLSLNWRILS